MKIVGKILATASILMLSACGVKTGSNDVIGQEDLGRCDKNTVW